MVLVFFLFVTSINSSNNLFTPSLSNISFTQPVTDPSPLGCQIVPQPNFLSLQVASIFISSIRGNDYLTQSLNNSSSSLISNKCNFINNPCQSISHALSQLSNTTCVINPCTGYVLFLLDDLLDDEAKSCNLEIPTSIPIMFYGVGSSKNWKCVSNSIFKEGNNVLYQGFFISNVKISGNFNLRVCLLYFVNSIAFNFRFSNKYFL